MTQSREQSLSGLEARIRELTMLMYDTRITVPELAQRVYPYLAPNVTFVDPWLTGGGRSRFELGLRGFHCLPIFRFDFEIYQVGVTLDGRGGGRAIVDGVMNLRQLRFFTYPLRTIITYAFELTGDERGLRITRQEEMWSFGDMIAAVPVAGRFYAEVLRPAFGIAFTAVSRLGCLPSRPAEHFRSPRRWRTPSV